MKKKVFVAMSGGVDSSVAAALLKRAKPSEFFKLTGRPTPKGFREFEVVGAHMKCWSGGSPSAGLRMESCSGEQDSEDARKAAEALGIPFYIFDFEKEYKDRVVEYMIDGYRRGITPNPDVMCNKEIKFGLFLKKALELGADYVATGHYVRLRRTQVTIDNKQLTKKLSGQKSKVKCQMFSAKDSNKDQSYFLWTLTQNQLKYCLFPLGDITKPEVRKLAKKFKLPNADKKDSQGICFLGQVNIKDFLKKYIPEKKGIILNTKGEIIGEHKGAQFYTIGQRHIGAANRGISRTKSGNARTGDFRPFYVAEKDMKENAILVAEDGEEILTRKEVELKNVNFINNIRTSDVPNIEALSSRTSDVQKIEIPVLARVRYRQPLFSALFIIHNSSFKLVFQKPVKFVASGQSAVFYSKKGEMLGGGVIK